MDRMLLSALILWMVVLSLFRFDGFSGTPEVAAEPDRAAAIFPHDAHMESVESCMACHHRYENGENVLQEDELDGGDAMRCRTCHTDGASIDARKAFHRQCIACHRSMEKQNAATGPRTCGTCHPNQVPEEMALLEIAR